MDTEMEEISVGAGSCNLSVFFSVDGKKGISWSKGISGFGNQTMVWKYSEGISGVRQLSFLR